MALGAGLTVSRVLPAFEDWYPLYLRALALTLVWMALPGVRTTNEFVVADGIRIALAWLLVLALRLVLVGCSPVARYSPQHVLLLRRTLTNAALSRASIISTAGAVACTGLFVWVLTFGTDLAVWLPLTAINAHLTLLLVRSGVLIRHAPAAISLMAVAAGSFALGTGIASLLGSHSPTLLAVAAAVGVAAQAVLLVYCADLMRGEVIDAARYRSLAATARQFAHVDWWLTGALRSGAGLGGQRGARGYTTTRAPSAAWLAGRGAWPFLLVVVCAAILVPVGMPSWAAFATTAAAAAAALLLFHPIRLDNSSELRRSLLARRSPTVAASLSSVCLPALGTAMVAVFVASVTRPPAATALWAFLAVSLVATDALRGGPDLGRSIDLWGPELFFVAVWVTSLMPVLMVLCSTVPPNGSTQAVALGAVVLAGWRVQEWWRLRS